MNPVTRKIILEHLGAMKTAHSRITTHYRAGSLNDPGYETIRKLHLAISEAESYFFNQLDDPPEEHPLIWALRTALKSNKEIADEDIAALVRQALKEGWEDGKSSKTEG
jgi:hypothetical protein